MKTKLILQELFFLTKPIIPRSVQIRLRQMVARRQLPRVSSVWPILESAGRPPEGWKGWPDGRRFAFVITHDVDTAVGQERCLRLAKIEEQRGFRSAFYFVPERRYRVSPEVRQDLMRRGFEVGVHGLYHDHKTFQSREEFCKRAHRINRYLREWGSVGFRSPSMIRNLAWIGDLDIEYDASTFDTDPFEPQPEEAGTIFPSWITRNGEARGFVELPYTLPQDFTLFALLKETSIDIWKRKLDWIVSKGGMALIDVHPCYMCMGNNTPKFGEYAIQRYEELLDYVQTVYSGQYWHAIPRDVARFWRSQFEATKPLPHETAQGISAPAVLLVSSTRAGGGQGVALKNAKIWIDLDNTPHVPFFKPIIRELKKRGYETVVTARDAFQVCDLADRLDVSYLKVGRHHGKNKILKIIGLFYRALQLAPVILRERPIVALSHGSRSQIILANMLRIPSVLIEDYEYAEFPLLMRPGWRIVPEVISDVAVSGKNGRTLKYPGIKENVYVPDFIPDPRILDQLQLTDKDIIVTMRPPATEAHYHNSASEELFVAAMQRLCGTPSVRIVLVPRNKKQAVEIIKKWPGWFDKGKVTVPTHPLDGLNLLWHSDIVISGGGTMNRESAALGVPVYSIFRGKIGAVDKYLAASGRLILLESIQDVEEKLLIKKHERIKGSVARDRTTLNRIVEHIVGIVEGSHFQNSLAQLYPANVRGASLNGLG